MSFITGPTRIPTQHFKDRKVRLQVPSPAIAALVTALEGARFRVEREAPMVMGYFVHIFLRVPRICIQVETVTDPVKLARQDATLAERNIATLRFTDSEVLADTTTAFEKIRVFAMDRGDQRHPHLRR